MVTQEVLQDSGLYRLDDIDLIVQAVVTERYAIRPDKIGVIGAEGPVRSGRALR